MNVFDAGYKLVGKQKHGLKGELAVAEVEKILQAGSEQIDHHGVVVTLSTEPANERNTNTTGKRLVNTGFIFKLRVLGLDTFELDGDFLAGDNVGAYVKSVTIPPYIHQTIGASTYQDRCHRNYRSRSYGQCGTYYRHASPRHGQKP